MRVLILSPVDTGGQGYRIAKGFQRTTDWTVDAVNSAHGSLYYPEQYPLRPTERMALARKLYAQADVIHLRNNFSMRKAFDSGDQKPTILHHHGTHFRANHAGVSGQARAIGAVQVASTLDLTLLERDVEWVPSPYDLTELAMQGLMRKPSDRIRIAHFPTSAKVKSTARFMAAVERLGERYPIEVITNVVRGKVRQMHWADVMAAKAQADIYFDQVILGYGNNAIEAWGMCIPVVAGVQDPKVRALMVERFGTLPFMEANEGTIEEALEALITSHEARAEYRAKGTAHVETFHDDATVVAQLSDIYRNAPPTRKLEPYASPGWRARNRRAA